MVLDRKGFTLIELLIVVIIIGVLATLAIPQYTNYVERARAAEALNMIGAINSAEAAYKLENNAYTNILSSTALNLDNVYTTNPSAIAVGQMWYYNITTAATSRYVVRANRSSKSSGNTSQYMDFTWSDTAGPSWGGTHPGVPKQ